MFPLVDQVVGLIRKESKYAGSNEEKGIKAKKKNLQGRKNVKEKHADWTNLYSPKK